MRWSCWWPSSYPCRDCISRRCSNTPLITSAPDDHFTASPHCRVIVSASGCVGRAGGRPTIRAGIVSPAGVQIAADDQLHPRRSFHCQSTLPCDSLGQWARWSCWWPSNYPCWDCISRRCSNSRRHHQIRPRRSFHCQSTLPCDRIGQWVRWSCWWPSNYPCWDCISRRCSKVELIISSTPDDHFTASPHCRVIGSASGCVGRAGGRPTIRAGIVSPAGVQMRRCHHIHPRRSFHCQSTLPCDCLGQWARWSCWWPSSYPCWDCISRRCSNSAAITSAPDDHFTASPHCRVNVSASGRVGRAGGRPAIIDAFARLIRYCR